MQQAVFAAVAPVVTQFALSQTLKTRGRAEEAAETDLSKRGAKA